MAESSHEHGSFGLYFPHPTPSVNFPSPTPAPQMWWTPGWAPFLKKKALTLSYLIKKESKTTVGVEEHSLVFPLSRNYKERSGGKVPAATGLDEQHISSPAGILRLRLGSTRVQDPGA